MKRFLGMAVTAMKSQISEEAMIGLIATIDDALCALHDMNGCVYDYYIDRIEEQIKRATT